MSVLRDARTLVLALLVSVGLVGFGTQATAVGQFTKKIKKTVIVYFSGQFFPTLAAARSMKGPKKYFWQVMTRVSNGTIIDGEDFWWMENSSFLPGVRIGYQGSFKMPNTLENTSEPLERSFTSKLGRDWTRSTKESFG